MLKSKSLTLFITVVICFSSINSLPVKESSSTPKDSNDHQQQDENQHNLENIIGKLFI